MHPNKIKYPKVLVNSRECRLFFSNFKAQFTLCFPWRTNEQFSEEPKSASEVIILNKVVVRNNHYIPREDLGFLGEGLSLEQLIRQISENDPK